MRYPSLYQINTRVFLDEVSRSHGRRLTLAHWPEDHLNWLQQQEFDWLWLLGVWQTGTTGRQVSRTQPGWQAGFREVLHDLAEEDITGSPYSIRRYTVHGDFGGNDALAHLRDRLHECGLRLMLDLVPNHTALDHPWVEEHPEYYIHGSESDLAQKPANFRRVETSRGPLVLAHGRDPYFPGWPDTLQLNYRHPGLRAAMIAELLQIAEHCDGVRADMAMLLLPDVIRQTWGELSLPVDGSDPVDVSFWPEALARVRRAHPTFLFLAEVYWDREWQMLQQGFDFAYDKRLYDRLRAGQAGPVRDHLQAGLDYQNRLTRFLENHDEPRAASAFPLPIHLAAAMTTYLTPGMRFFHEGQLEGRRVHVSIHLGRRPPEKPDQVLAEFYRRLLECLKLRELREGQWTMRRCRPGWDGNPSWQDFLAWTWQAPEMLPLLVCINFGPIGGQCYVELPLEELRGRKLVLVDLMGSARYEREGDELFYRGLYLDIPPWNYHLFAIQGV
jgi:glycosidase